MLGLLVLIIPIAIGVAILRLPFRQPKIWGPVRCKRCQYIVAGLEGKICPECGSDLKVVGTTTRDGFLPPTPAYLAVAWSLFVLFATLIPVMVLYLTFVERYGPQLIEAGGDFTLESWPKRAKDGHSYSISWEGTNIGFSAAPPQVVKVRLVKTDGQRGLARRVASLDLDERSDRQGEISGQVRKWVEGSGIDSSDEQSGHEVEGIERLVHGIFARPADQPANTRMTGLIIATGGSHRSSRRPNRFDLAPLGVCAVVWATGLWCLLKRRGATG